MSSRTVQVWITYDQNCPEDTPDVVAANLIEQDGVIKVVASFHDGPVVITRRKIHGKVVPA